MLLDYWMLTQPLIPNPPFGLSSHDYQNRMALCSILVLIEMPCLSPQGMPMFLQTEGSGSSRDILNSKSPVRELGREELQMQT